VLKAGNTDKSFSIEKLFKDGASNYFHRFVGNQCSGFTLSVDASSNAEITFDLLGMDRNTATGAIPSSTYLPQTVGEYLTGLNTTITVAGVTAVPRSLEITCTQQRETQDQFGSAAARAVATSGFREVKMTVQFYRSDLSLDTLFAKSDTPVAVSASVGTAANGYQFAMAQANADIPADEEDNSKPLITVVFTAKDDTSAGTDFTITKTT
jgi:hypothetical protein